MANATPAPATEATPVTVEVVSLEAVVSDPANARKHDEKNRRAIRGSLRRFGAGRSIVLDKNNVVRAGNGTVEEARAEGFTEVLVVTPKPGQLVAVKRPDWSETEATGYALADNRAGELAEWDESRLMDQLRAIEQDGLDPATVGFDPEDLEGFGVEPGEVESDPGPNGGAAPPDDSPPIHQILITCRGEEELHRLIERFDAEGLEFRVLTA